MARRTDISNNADIIDSRYIIARVEEMEEEREALVEALQDARETLAELQAESSNDEDLFADKAALEAATKAVETAEENLDDWSTDNGEDWKALHALNEEAPGDEWNSGATLIRESYFVDYCEELCKDIGDLPRDLPSYLEIDWEATANNLRVDYSEVDYNGVTYLVR